MRASEGQGRFPISHCEMGLPPANAKVQILFKKEAAHVFGLFHRRQKIILYIPVVQERGLYEEVGEIPFRCSEGEVTIASGHLESRTYGISFAWSVVALAERRSSLRPVR